MKGLLLTLLFFLLSLISVSGQKDTLFWFVAPEISKHVANFDLPIVFRITTYDQPADVIISQPAGAGMPDQHVQISPNSTKTVDLSQWLDIIENKPANAKLNYGLKISSSTPVCVYYEVVSEQCRCNPEIYVLKGQNALGQEFYIPSQNLLKNSDIYTPRPYSAFDIVATENNTNISITPSSDITGHTAGIPFTVTLNEGQTYSAAATGNLAAEHLMGSKVVSDKPIAITIKDDLLDGGSVFGGLSADQGGDQIVPVNILGTEYIAVKGNLYRDGDRVFITAVEDGTGIEINGSLVTTINKGQTYAYQIKLSAVYINLSKPAYVLQLTGIGAETSLGLLPSIKCTGSNSVSFTRATADNLYLILVVKSGGEDGFRINGNSSVISPADFTFVPNTNSKWMSCKVSLDNSSFPKNSVVKVTNEKELFHLGVLNGGSVDGGVRFGFFSNFSDILVRAQAVDNEICVGADLELKSEEISFGQYFWSGPDNFSSTEHNPVIKSVSKKNQGTYTLKVVIKDCDTLITKINVDIKDCNNFINEYTEILSIDTCANAVTVGNQDSLKEGQRVLIIQMKGASIDSTNSPQFGKISDIANAGNYEFQEISEFKNGQVYFKYKLLNRYDIKSRVQLVTVPQFESYTVDDKLTCIPWNGKTGGVLVFEVKDRLILNEDIDVTGLGFKGGVNGISGSNDCSVADYYFPGASDKGGTKGENIFDLSAGLSKGRGNSANGGGGGNANNSGGGGGSNAGIGGNGGNENNQCNNAASNGGIGGDNLSSFINMGRIFLGGGGGAGIGDVSPNEGGAGGGIIIISARSIQSNGHKIITNGSNGSSPSGINSSGGGAGGGGSILLDIENYEDIASIYAQGGIGGNTGPTDAKFFGPGGGGGGGLVKFRSPVFNQFTSVDGGSSGTDSSMQPYNAEDGDAGRVLTDLKFPASNIVFEKPVLDSLYSNTPLCIGKILKFTVQGKFPQGTTFQWTGPDGFQSQEKEPEIKVPDKNKEGIYMLKIFYLDCEYLSKSAEIRIIDYIRENVEASICKGDYYTLANGRKVNLPGTYMDTLVAQNDCDTIRSIILNVHDIARTTHTYNICEGDSIVVNGHIYRLSGEYTDTLTSKYNCDSITLTKLTVLDTTYSIREYIFCEGDSVRVGNKYYTTSGYFKDILSNINGCDSTIISVVKPGESNYCENLHCKMFIPNAFSPNEDNINDVFEVYSDLAKVTELNIYDRWGGLLYKDVTVSPKWNGTDQDGKLLTSGVYVYVIKGYCDNFRQFIKYGDVTLLR